MSEDDRRVGPCGKYCAVVDECEARGDVIRELRAENARLRAHVKAAYYEGYGDRHMHGDTDDANDTSGWALSAARAAVGEKE